MAALATKAFPPAASPHRQLSAALLAVDHERALAQGRLHLAEVAVAEMLQLADPAPYLHMPLRWVWSWRREKMGWGVRPCTSGRWRRGGGRVGTGRPCAAYVHAAHQQVGVELEVLRRCTREGPAGRFEVDQPWL